MYQIRNEIPMIRGTNMNMQADTRCGFLAPFVLGGITGGLLAPSFYPQRPYPVPYPVPYPPYPPYSPYPPYKSYTNVVY